MDQNLIQLVKNWRTRYDAANAAEEDPIAAGGYPPTGEWEEIDDLAHEIARELETWINKQGTE